MPEELTTTVMDEIADKDQIPEDPTELLFSDNQEDDMKSMEGNTEDNFMLENKKRFSKSEETLSDKERNTGNGNIYNAKAGPTNEEDDLKTSEVNTEKNTMFEDQLSKKEECLTEEERNKKN